MDKFAYLKALRTDQIPPGLRLTNAEFRTLVMIFNYTDHDGRNARPSAERLATDIGITKTLVWRQIKALKQKGYLVITNAGGPAGAGARKANTYALTLPAEVVNVGFTTNQLSGEPGIHSTSEPGLHQLNPSSEPQVHQVVNVGFTTSSEPQVPTNRSLSNQEQSTAANAGALAPRKGWRQIFAEHQLHTPPPGQQHDGPASPLVASTNCRPVTPGSRREPPAPHRAGASEHPGMPASHRSQESPTDSEQRRTRNGLLSVNTYAGREP